MSYPPPPQEPGQPDQPQQQPPPLTHQQPGQWQPPQPGQYQQPGYGYGYGGPPAAQTSGKATASLVLGILGMLCLGLFAGIPAIVLGILAKKEIKASQGRVSGDGLATAGIVLGSIATLLSLVVVGVFVAGSVATSTFGESCSAITTSGGSFSTEC